MVTLYILEMLRSPDDVTWITMVTRQVAVSDKASSTEPPSSSAAMPPSIKFKRALKTAARFPVRAVSGSRLNAFAPLPNEVPLVVLRLQVLGCTNLLSKDRSGTSDPFIVISVLNTRQNTAVVKRSLSPTYAPKDATFDFPIYASLAEKLGAVELVVWDKDFVSKDYLGEVAVLLEDWFADGRSFGFDDLGNKVRSILRSI